VSAAAPAPPPCSSLTLRAASHSPGPPLPPHTCTTGRFRQPPAPAGLSSTALARAAGSPVAAASTSTEPLAERRVTLPQSAPRARGERGSRAGCGGRGKRGASVAPPPACGRGRSGRWASAAAAAAAAAAGAGTRTRPKGPGGGETAQPPSAVRLGESGAASALVGR
jgi:hypothetical protein